MDADLQAMRSFERYVDCVDLFLAPVLEVRLLVPMPCKHRQTFEVAKSVRNRQLEALGLEGDADADADDMESYCDCGPFNRRNELWLIGDACLKPCPRLTKNQLRDLADIILLHTRHNKVFTYNNVKHAIHDLFNKKYADYLRQVKRKREEGMSFSDIAEAVVPEWQYRMMPNI